MTKILFVEARKKFNQKEIRFTRLDSLPEGEISLAATIQYIDLIKPVKEYLESKGRKVLVEKGAYYEGHVLGCNPSAFDSSKEVLLLLCDGKFHALNNSLILNKPLFVFNTQTLEQINEEDLNIYKRKKKAKQMKFLREEKVGLIISTKQGQKTKAHKVMKEKIEKAGKRVYLFEADNIDIGDLDNFNDIRLWINTACFGLALDDPRIINFQDIINFL